MGNCSVCGDYEQTGYTCNYCGKTHCVSHRLPESHHCPALSHFGEISKRLQSDTDAKQKRKHREKAEERSRPTFESSEQRTPKPIEKVRTYGGSGRDRENANFPRSPDVNPDGSLGESEVKEITRDYANDEDTQSRIRKHLNEYIWTYGLVTVVFLILQFGLGIDVLSLLQQYLPGI